MTLLNIEEIPVETYEDIVTLTPSGAQAVMGLLQRRNLAASEYALRVFIQGGGGLWLPIWHGP